MLQDSAEGSKVAIGRVRIDRKALQHDHNVHHVIANQYMEPHYTR